MPVHRAGAGVDAEQSAAVYPVPWRVRRPEEGVVEVEHCGQGPLYSVRFSLAGGGVLGLSLPCAVLPGERVAARVRNPGSEAALAAPDAMLVLRWFQPDGRELLWPVAL